MQTALLVTAALAAAALATAAQLAASTEHSAVRAALAALPASATAVDVEVVRPGGDAGALRDDVGAAVGRALGGPVPPSALTALTRPLPTTAGGGDAVVTLAAADRLRDVARLEAGRWPRAGRAEAVLPSAAARALGLAVGDRVRLADGAGPGAVAVTGLYRARPSAALWRLDPLGGAGEDPAWIDPDSTAALPVVAFGPLLAAPATLADAPLQVVDLRLSPDVRGTPPAALRAEAARIESIDEPVALAVGRGSLSTGVTSGLPDALRRLARGLDAARAPVAVAGGLLAALTAAVLLGMARLVAAGRAGEQQLLASRGAGRGRLAALVLAEAGVTGLVVALVAAAIAGPAAALVAGGPPVAAGAPAWTTAIGAGVAVAAVLVAAALRPADRDRSGRAPRLTAAARSGADLAVAGVALLLVQRLAAVAGPPTGVVLAAPVLVVLAAALLGRRLVAPVGRLAEPLAARSRAIAGALVAFELSRRARRSTAAVLVTAVGLGTTASAVAQLATWDASQGVQAAFALGAPARGTDGPGGAPLVVRTEGLLTAGSAGAEGTASIGLTALPAAAGDLLTRLPDAGSRAMASLSDPPAAHELALPAGTRALRLVLPAATRNEPRPSTTTVTALLRDADGLVVRSGSASFGTGAVTAVLPLPQNGDLRLAGLDLDFALQEQDVRFPVSALTATGARGMTPLRLPGGWSAVQTDGSPASALPSSGFADLAGGSVPGAGGRSALRLLAWSPSPVAAVVDRPAGRAIGLGGTAQLLVAGQQVPVEVVRTAPRLPASLPVSALLAGGPLSRASAVAVDLEAVQRGVVERGGTLAGEAQERWSATAGRGGVDTAGLTARLLGAPLRVAVRPALALTAAAGVLLACLAFLAQTAAARHERRFDLAQLRAAGAGRAVLAAVDLRIAGVQLALGGLIGVPAGLLAAALVATRVVTDPVGGPAVPTPVLDPAAGPIAAVVATTALVVLGAVGGSALAASRRSTAALIRAGDEP